MKELRIKSNYEKKEEVRAAMGIKIVAHGLDDAVAGSQLLVAQQGDDIEEFKERVQEEVKALTRKLHKTGVGVYVQASSLGSMEALMDFLEKGDIPVSNFRIGDVHRRDILTASIMHDRGKPEYACILAFDVDISQESEQHALQHNVRIFREEIIYRLEEDFKEYLDEIKRFKAEEARKDAVFPCVLKFLKDYLFRDRDPIVIGVQVQAGILKLHTPLCVIKDGEILEIGKVTSIQKEHNSLDEAKIGQEVAVSIHSEKKSILLVVNLMITIPVTVE